VVAGHPRRRDNRFGDVGINDWGAPMKVGPDEAAVQRSWPHWVMDRCRPVSLSAPDAATDCASAPG
jgi:hypothetical protein